MRKVDIKRVLVANRGEIALRIMRSLHELGIETVAIYSDADQNSPHVLYADKAFNVGPPPSSESYLQMDKILKICKDDNVDAIHPGYGFLSENATFAKKAEDSGITFIGPDSNAIQVMGDKLTSKTTVAKYDVPLVPGMSEPVTDPAIALDYAKKIGFPVMVKASAGGGGKGMRIVNKEAEFEEAMKRAKSEAKSAFGDDAIFVEKMIQNPKHIEVQILGDLHGNYVYLHERECSVQRRNQKVIEEAPSAVVTAQKRKELGEAAINVARSCNYVGAGTVEFIADDKLNFYFLEMNTRLQVEHPVTEMITGIDIVKEQINIASGNPLSFTQDQVELNGHSIEVRVYAEDPMNNFLPDIGVLKTYQRPQGPGIRVDDGYRQGMEIPIYYDPMISKLVVHGKDRSEAIDRMLRAIQEYKIHGVKTTLEFCAFALDHPEFRDGSFTTKFVEKYFTPDKLKVELTEEEIQAVLVASTTLVNRNKTTKQTTTTTSNTSKWTRRKYG